MAKSPAIRAQPSVSTDPKWFTCNGRQLRKMAIAGLASLEKNYRKVNDLNVFPVPDGDTGTNMLLTMRAACKRIENSDDDHVGQVAGELSHGALMGARGNSGVILSQIWRGFARSLKENEMFDAQGLAAAFREASDTAYNGVMRPVEGTILTVIREGAEEAEKAVMQSKDLRRILERVIERCQESLENTPELLPILKQAGVVDAGGQGLVYILEGMLAYGEGQKIEIAAPAPAEVPAQAKAAPAGGLEFPYDVQYILTGTNLDVDAVRKSIDAMGDSTVVAGDTSTIKVHVHVKDPGMPISYGISVGKISDVVIENMQLQMEEIIAGAPQIEQPAAAIDLEPGQIGVVAVASGEGLAQIFQSLGAAGIVNGGQSNNPSTEEIFRVVENLPTDMVIILPNNKNIILAAEAVRDLTSKQIRVIPTTTVPQGVSALLSFERDSDLDDVSEAMREACTVVSSGEIATATRSAVLDGVHVDEGELIGVANGRLCVSADSLAEVLRHLLSEMGVDERELVSVYFGEDASQQDAEALAAQIQELYPHLEVEVLPGGQAIYSYILGAE